MNVIWFDPLPRPPKLSPLLLNKAVLLLFFLSFLYSTNRSSTNVYIWCKKPRLQSILAIHMPTTLSLIISTFWYKVRNKKLPFTQILRGHCRVINWSYLNIAVSKGIGKPKERVRNEGMANQYIYELCLVFMWAWFVVLQNNYNSKMKAHWSQITMTNIRIMTKSEILWELPKCITETQSEEMLLEKWGW